MIARLKHTYLDKHLSVNGTPKNLCWKQAMNTADFDWRELPNQPKTTLLNQLKPPINRGEYTTNKMVIFI